MSVEQQAVADDRLVVDFGYVNGRPDESAYQSAAEQEVERMTRFLGLGSGCWQSAP